MNGKDLLLHHAEDFPLGYTAITTIGEADHDTGINFGIRKMKAGEVLDVTSDLESAYLLMNGAVTFLYDDTHYEAKRNSLFDEAPIAIHFAANMPVKIQADSDAELAVQQVENSATFETLVFDEHNMLENEHRGQGLLGDTAYRMVRTIFDIRNRPDAKLVLGEVINFPGRWSSYPPHHHNQPELYHYRFTEPQGYGHGESGEDVLKIHQHDTLKILYNRDHSHCSAPGYGMYYIWVIRHLPNDPYTVPNFTEAHDWTRAEDANKRAWKG